MRPVRETARLSGVLLQEPRAFPAELLAVLRASFRAIWRARGGGLYACGFLVTFVILEVRMFVDDVTDAAGVGDFFLEQAFELFFRFTIESFRNTMLAFLWPLYLIDFRPPTGMIALVVMYVLFPMTLKKPIERWLFDGELGAARTSGDENRSTEE